MRKALATFIHLFMLSTSALAASWEDVIHQSYEYTQARQLELEEHWHLSDYDHWDLDQDKGQLIFSKDGAPALVSRFQFVGSYSNTSRTWLWSWANTSMLGDLSAEMATVRNYGERNGFRKLTEEKWAATQEDGWEMTAVANYLLKGKGVYRPPFGQVTTFLVITEIKKVTEK